MSRSTNPRPGQQSVEDAAQDETREAIATDADSANTAHAGLIGPLRARHISLLGGVALVLAAVLFVATRPLTDAATSGAQTGTSFYQLSAAKEGLQVGERAPDFVGTIGEQQVRLTDLDGQALDIANFRGRPLWVFFWATWCPPCQQETPDVRDAFEAHRDEGLVVLAIDIQEPADVVRDYVERYDLQYTIGTDSQAAIATTYRVFGLPSHYFIDRDGIVRDRYFGPLTREAMEERIRLISEP